MAGSSLEIIYKKVAGEAPPFDDLPEDERRENIQKELNGYGILPVLLPED